MSQVAHRVVSSLPPGTSFSRYIRAKALGHGDMASELAIAEAWRDCPQVRATLELRLKAAIPAGATSDATWAGPLSVHGIADEALTLLRGLSILGALEGRMRRVPMRVKVPVETGNGVSGGWVAEGAPVPVQKTAFSTSIEENFKFGCIVPLSMELARISRPDAEETIRKTTLGGLAASIDNQFLLPTVAAVSGVNPASVTNGSTEITSTGTTSAQISADLSGMLSAISTPGPLVWIMKPKTMYRISLVLGSQAAGLPATLFGIPVIASINSPGQIALLDPAAILYSDSGQFDADVSEVASVELNDAPADPTVAATVFESAWARDLVFIKVLRWLAWLRPLSGSVSFMSVSY